MNDAPPTQPDWIIWSRFALRPRASSPSGPPAAVRHYGDLILDTIAPEIDHGFYSNVAALAPDADPVRHFAESGWQAGLNPNTWFDTKFYLEFYPDITKAGINPLFHFIYYGRAEGRMPARPGGQPRHVIERARVPSRRPPGWDAPEDAPALDAVTLEAALSTACLGATGLVLAASHDGYLHVTGGTQILIADEQALFAADRVAYLHIAPAIARFTFAPPGEEVLLQVSLDGRFLGLAPESLVEAALRAPFLPTHRLFIVHSVLGHRAATVARLAAILRPAESVFWLHDYAALCEGFHLLRNDIAYCQAPSPASTACRICVYGAEREGYLAAMHRLFTEVPFHVVAPSQVALDLFLARSTLPFRTARVHEHAVLVCDNAAAGLGANTSPGLPRIGFAGFAIPPKGWPAFQRLLQRQAGHAGYRFFHFAIATHLVPMTGLEKVDVEVRAGARFAMVRALQEAEVDFVAVLSPWPETFSFVVHEAIAAGADVVALADSGNVAAAVRRYARGVVLRDADAFLRFFDEGWALDYIRQRNLAPIERPGLLLTGTTATIDLACLTPAPLAEMHTDDPALAVLLPDGRSLPPEPGTPLRFALPAGTLSVWLVSRHAIMAQDGPARGVQLAAITLDGVALPLDDPSLAEGWHAAEPDGRWTTGRAKLRLPGARMLELALSPGATWRRLPLAAPGQG